MNTLIALETLFTMIGSVEGIPQAIRDFAALIRKARDENRDITPDELTLLRLDDDEAKAVLDAAIAAQPKTTWGVR